MFCSKEPLLKLGDRSWSGVRERDLIFWRKGEYSRIFRKREALLREKKVKPTTMTLKIKKFLILIAAHSDILEKELE